MQVAIPSPVWWRKFWKRVGLDKGDVVAVFLLTVPFWIVFFERPWAMFFVLLGVMLLNDSSRGRRLSLKGHNLIIVGALVAIVGSTALWSIAPERSLTLGAEVAAFGAAIWLALGSVNKVSKPEADKIGKALVIAVWATIALLAVEQTTDLAVSAWVFSRLGLKPPTWLPWLNKPTVYMVLFLFPSLWWLLSRGKAIQAVSLAIAASVIVWLSASDAAMMALGMGLIYYALNRLFASAGRLITCALILAVVFVGPLIVAAKSPFPSVYQLIENRSFSLNHRLLIWEFGARQFHQHKWLGAGAGSYRSLPGENKTRLLVLRHRESGAVLARSEVKLRPNHPHSIGWELLLDFGAVGALLTLGLLGFLMVRTEDAYGPATILVFASAMSISYSVWNTDLVAMLALALVAVRAVAPVTDQVRHTTPDDVYDRYA